MRAVKENSRNLIHVLKCVKKRIDKKSSDKKNSGEKSSILNSRSVLKSVTKPNCEECEQCRNKTLLSMNELKRHFEVIHGCLITLKSISNEPVEVIPNPGT